MSTTGVEAASDDERGPALERVLEGLVRELDLPAKVRLLTGADFWSLPAEERIGLEPIVFSDGPAGVRGGVWDERDPSLSLPSGSALGATWDPGAATRYGDLLGREAVRKKVQVLLGPTVNLHRSPYGGRHFEGLSEDPLLTARLAAAYVRAVQAHGVAACPKHYVANEYEVERHTASSEVDERTLREVYLMPFEQAVVEARSWAVMSAYNGVNGVTMSEHPLLREPLKDSWGFDGVVVSDWLAVTSTEASANAAQDLVMPHLLSPWGKALVDAVGSGRVPEAAIDEKLIRVLRLGARVGALDLDRPGSAGERRRRHTDDTEAIAELAADGMVLLRNQGLLPVESAPMSIAVIGPHAMFPRIQGGGSATVVPDHVVSPLEGLRDRFPAAEVGFAMGAEAPTGIFPFEPALLTDPVTGGEGIHVTATDATGAVLLEETRRRGELWWLGTMPTGATTLTLAMRYTPRRTERCLLGAACAAPVEVAVDGEVVVEMCGPAGDRPELTMDGIIASDMFAPPVRSALVHLEAERPVEVTVTCDLTGSATPMVHAIQVGMAPHAGSAEDMVRDAVELARGADLAVVVVGTSPRMESEGSDRSTLALPADQDEMVRAVARVNPRTLVVVNAGGPVLMPWRDEVAAVLLGWFGGQEIGTAIARIVAGDHEPGGRLPTTWPRDEDVLPVGPDVPVEGKVHYREGLHVGYRGWLRDAASPAFCFGHGLGYTTWALGDVAHPPVVTGGEDTTLLVEALNTGNRAGKLVLQVYLEREDSAVERPVRWLAGFAAVRLGAGEDSTVPVRIPARAFASWTSEGWWYEPGSFRLLVGTSVEDIVFTGNIQID